EDRIERIKEELVEREKDAFLGLGPSDAFYLSGFRTEGEDYPAVLIPQEGEPLLLVSRLDLETARSESTVSVVKIEEGLARSVEERVQGEVLTSEGIGLGLYREFDLEIETSDILTELRSVKEEGEVEKIREAYRNVENAFSSADFSQEKTERETAAELEYTMRVNGSDGTSFNTIVASGKRSSLPHHATSDRKIGEGPVLLDAGSRMKGYVSDLSRSFHIGQPDSDFREVYEAVREAQEEAERKLEAGRKAAEVDKAAREHLEEEGLGDRFVHSTGHGVGIDVHEAPNLYRESDDELEAGMVVTLEPAVYLDERFGVRIEDAYLVTESGSERLTELPRDLESQVIEV
ncbi:MAG: M24 family metallopeptidase, partial [Candidatus Nanohaloarchaea archaeon]